MADQQPTWEVNPFALYPQHPNADFDRPWWRATDFGWERNDGVSIQRSPTRNPGWGIEGLPIDFISARDVGAPYDFAAMSVLDAHYPMEVPTLLAGQVWMSPPGIAATVQEVNHVEAKNWKPDEGEVLVAGPGAPWVPAGWTPIRPDVVE